MKERILAFMHESGSEFVSGEQLSEALGISRTAVWKHISRLRDEGYAFEAVPRRGYRLLREPSRLSASGLLEKLHTRVMGHNLKLYDEVESTQNVAHELVREGAGEGTLVIAEQQHAGRGRLGRSWHSPKGKGVWMSLVLKPRIPVHFTPQLTLLIAVALCRTLRGFADNAKIGIKWPNDLLIDGRKVSGILLESRAEDERLHYIVAGIGISANLAPHDYPEELRDKATSLYIASGREVDRELLVCDFLKQFEELYVLYHEQGFAPIRTLWEASTLSLGRPIAVLTAGGRIEGVAESIDDMGALSVRMADGTLHRVYSGEIEF